MKAILPILLLLSVEINAQTPSAFKFSPAVPSTYTEEVVTTRTTIAIGIEPAEEVTKQKTKVQVSREGDDFIYTFTPIEFSVTRDKLPVSDPAIDALKKVSTKYTVTSDGRLKQVTGFENVLAEAIRDQPKEMKPILEKLLSDKALIEKEKQGWALRVTDLVGRKIEPKSAWVSVGRFISASQPVECYVGNVIIGTVEEEGRKLVEIRYIYTIDADRIRVQMNDLARDTVGDFALPGALKASPGFSIQGQGARFVDPDTLQIVRDQYSRQVQFILSAGKDQSAPVILKESRIWKINEQAAQ